MQVRPGTSYLRAHKVEIKGLVVPVLGGGSKEESASELTQVDAKFSP